MRWERIYLIACPTVGLHAVTRRARLGWVTIYRDLDRKVKRMWTVLKPETCPREA